MCKSEAMMWSSESSGHCLRHIQSVQHQRSFHSSRFGGLLPIQDQSTEEIQYARLFSKQRKPNQLNSTMWLPNDEVCIMWCIVTPSSLQVDISLWMSFGKMLGFTKTLTSNRQEFDYHSWKYNFEKMCHKNKHFTDLHKSYEYIVFDVFDVVFFHIFHHFHITDIAPRRLNSQRPNLHVGIAKLRSAWPIASGKTHFAHPKNRFRFFVKGQWDSHTVQKYWKESIRHYKY